jgi:hypothetical protein
LGKSTGLSGILSVCQGALGTKVLSVCLELEVFTRISKGTANAESISQESGVNLQVLKMLLNACKSLGLVTEKTGSLKNSPAAEAYLVKGKEGYAGDFMVLLGEEYYNIWRGFREVVMTGKPVRDDRMARLSNPRYADIYIKAMHGISKPHSEEVARLLKPSGRKAVLDVGGGSGTYSISIAKQHPDLKVVIFDSPFSCEAAEKYITSSGTKNVTTQGGDFVMGGIPSGSDIIMLTNVLSTLPPARGEALCRKVFDALPKGGMIVVNEFRLDNGGASPAFSSLFALNAFMLSNGGSLYTYEQMSEWLISLGFSNVKLLKTSSEFLVSIVADKK